MICVLTGWWTVDASFGENFYGLKRIRQEHAAMPPKRTVPLNPLLPRVPEESKGGLSLFDKRRALLFLVCLPDSFLTFSLV